MLKIRALSKNFGHLNILKNIHLDINEGEFISLVGASGSGKSTLLRIIAGLESASSGELFLQNENLSKLSIRDRNFAMVFQNYALYPHLSVFENLSMPLVARASWRRKLPLSQARRAFKKELESKVRAVAQKLQIAHILQKKPAELSGGQCQRVALGRAIIRKPRIFLMDEPLSNLDAKLRIHTRGELSAIHKELKKTFIYVTHDQSEAMTMSDRIAFLEGGELLQVGRPQELYNDPGHLKVAKFIGTPTINTFNIKLRGEFFEFSKDAKSKVLALRPQHCFLQKNGLKAQIFNIENMGNEVFIYSKILINEADCVLVLRPCEAENHHLGDCIEVGFDLSKALFFDEAGKRISLQIRGLL